MLRNAREDRDRCLVQHRSRQLIAAFGDAADPVGLAGLIAPRRQAEMGADIGRLPETRRIVNGGAECQRHEAPTPGTVIIRPTALSLRAAVSASRCSFASCSRIALRALSSGVTIASNSFPGQEIAHPRVKAADRDLADLKAKRA